MKGGRVPIHIMRWAPADYHADEHVKLLKARRDYRTLTFYRHFLDLSFASGGDLPADPEALAAIVEMPVKDVARALSYCVGRLIVQEGERLFQPRVRRDVTEELEFREQQAERGRRGGRPKLESDRKATEKPTLSVAEATEKPAVRRAPAPFASAVRLTPDAVAGANGGGQAANPLLAGRRPELERECLALVRRMEELTGEDPIEIIGRASGYEGARSSKLNPATMTDDRLANTLRDLRADVAAEERKRAKAATSA